MNGSHGEEEKVAMWVRVNECLGSVNFATFHTDSTHSFISKFIISVRAVVFFSLYSFSSRFLWQDVFIYSNRFSIQNRTRKKRKKNPYSMAHWNGTRLFQIQCVCEFAYLCVSVVLRGCLSVFEPFSRWLLSIFTFVNWMCCWFWLKIISLQWTFVR